MRSASPATQESSISGSARHRVETVPAGQAIRQSQPVSSMALALIFFLDGDLLDVPRRLLATSAHRLCVSVCQHECGTAVITVELDEIVVLRRTLLEENSVRRIHEFQNPTSMVCLERVIPIMLNPHDQSHASFFEGCTPCLTNPLSIHFPGSCNASVVSALNLTFLPRLSFIFRPYSQQPPLSLLPVTPLLQLPKHLHRILHNIIMALSSLVSHRMGCVACECHSSVVVIPGVFW